MSKRIKETKLWVATWDKSVGRFRVRRTVYYTDGTRKLENKPHKEYQKFDKDEDKINEYLHRENYRQAQKELAKKTYKIRTAFIKGKDFNKEFEEWMFNRTRNRIYSKAVASSVRRYLIGYFHDKKKNYDYITWTSLKSQAGFVEFLKAKKLAYKTMITAKNNANMFFQYLSEESDGEIDLLKFTFPSLKRSGVRRYEKERIKKARLTDKRLSGDDYVTKEDFELIFNYCKNTAPIRDPERYSSILPYIWVAYHYGLRRSEAMALKQACFKKGYLKITEQLVKTNTYAELKHGADHRKIPHFFTEDNKRAVKGMLKKIEETQMHPTTFTNRFGEVMKALNMTFTIHNLRNTFITNCFFKEIPSIEIMLAAGHTDLRTTQRYIRDSRNLDDEDMDFDDLDDFTFDQAI